MRVDLSGEKKGWLQQFINFNPFFIASALMILLGMALVVNDDSLFSSEGPSSLIFSLASVELYQVCLVLAAAYLAKRLIHYDSLLLLVIEFVFLVIPFILLTVACQTGESLDQVKSMKTASWMALVTGVIAVVMVILRFLFFLKTFPGLKFHSRVLILGGVFLAFNLVIPLGFYFPFDQEANFTAQARYDLFEGIMLFGLPYLALFINWLPRMPKPTSDLPKHQPWIPFTGIVVLALMTVYHLVWIWFTYATEVPLTVGVFLPVAWVLVWTLWNRCGDFISDAVAEWRYKLHIIPVAMAVIYLLILLYFKGIGGYKAVTIDEMPEEHEAEALAEAAATTSKSDRHSE